MPIDINCDLGEAFGNYSLGCDDQIIHHITSANLACGFHAADPLVMETSVKLAAAHGVVVGAHPGYPDLRGFGRRNLDCTAQEIRSDVIYQVGALAALARVAGVSLQHVKPHGALYNTASGSQSVAQAVCSAVADYDPSLILVTLAGPAGDVIRQVARGMGLKVAREAFADRAYTPKGDLVSRRLPGAVITDPGEVAERCLRMAQEGTVLAQDGTVVPLEPHTICVHGDTPTAVELVKSIKERLTAGGVDLMPLGRFL